MSRVKMYKTASCAYCESALRLLDRKGVRDVEKINVDELPEQHAKMMEITGRRTVPQIFIGERHVGGYEDLVNLDRAGELDGVLGLSADANSI